MGRGKAEEAQAGSSLASAVPGAASSLAPNTHTHAHSLTHSHACSRALEGLHGDAERGWHEEWEAAELSLLRRAAQASLCDKGRSLFGATFPWGMLKEPTAHETALYIVPRNRPSTTALKAGHAARLLQCQLICPLEMA
jgi:hypothetical protein